MNYFNQSLASLHEALATGAFTSEQLMQQSLDNIKTTDKTIKAFLRMNDKALEQAKAIDEKGIADDQPLAGIPIAIKDNILTKGLLTTAASKILNNFVPIFNATVIEKLQQAGMIVIGKTNLDEFAMGSSTETSAYQMTHNAWNYDKVPGGSSGGSAAAVASGQVIAALGSDTGGSIRQPSAFNGVVGFKPTYGRISRWGLITFSSSLDEIGVITRSVLDNAKIMNVLAGQDEKDPTTVVNDTDFIQNLDGDISGMKIALPCEFMGEGVDPQVRETIMAAADTFRSLGATVEEVGLPYSKYAVPTYYIVASSEASSNLQRYDGIRYGFRAPDAKTLEDVYVKSRTEGFGEEVKRRIMLGTFSLSAGYYDAYFKKAAQVRALITKDFMDVFKDYDLIMAPTTPTPAFNIGEKVTDPVTMYMNDVLTISANLAGVPAASIPAGFNDEGLPIGMQLIGKHFDENTVYRAGYAFEQATDFHNQVPTVGGEA